MSVLEPSAHIVRRPNPYQSLRPRRTVGKSDWTWRSAWLLWRHPRRRGWLGDAYNRYGVHVTVIRCVDCGSHVFFCPALRPEIRKFNEDCGGPFCTSYDPHRDVGLLFAPEPFVPLRHPSRLERIVLRYMKQSCAICGDPTHTEWRCPLAPEAHHGR